MIEGIVICALAAWAITYGLVFSALLEPLREAVGIGYDLDEQGKPVERWANTTLGELLNCHCCTGFWTAVAMALLWISGLKVIVEVFAVAGGVLLVGRWWVSQKCRKEWWT